jgi:signal transduction histidine kinase
MIRRPSIFKKDPYGASRDRILAFIVVLIVVAPILAYTWVALDEEKASRSQLALDRSTGTAQLAAGLIDEHCEKVVVALQQLTRHPSFNRIGPDRNTASANTLLDQTVSSLSDLSYAAWYGPDGRLLQSSTREKPIQVPKSRTDVLERLRNKRLERLAFTDHTIEGDTVHLAVAIWFRGKNLGCVIAGIPSSAFNDWLVDIRTGGNSLYVVDDEGHVLSSSGPSWHRHLPLGDYQPTRFAVSGLRGSLQTDGPDGSEDCFVGYAHAPLSRSGVLFVLPTDNIFGPTNFLVQRLSLLLLPLLLLVSAWAWQRIQSERRIGELAYQLAEQNETLRTADQAKSEFLANVSHDLRTPLAAMQVSISGLLESPNNWSQKEVRDTLEVVSEEIDQLSARVRNLLDMARLESGAEALQREPEDLTDIVSSALERLEPLTRGNTIRADFPSEPLMVDCDQSRIETVIINLIENAVKYSPEGSTIYLQGLLAEDEVELRIGDEGIGLDPGDEEKVFEMYYRSGRGRAIRGTGVGLAICKAIVEAHGGQIGARKADAGGAEFWFKLPALTALPDLPEPGERPEAVHA